MLFKVLQKINVKLKSLYRQSRYLTFAFTRLLSNALIQPNFDYVCSLWFPLSKKFENQTLRSSNQKYSLLCKFTFKISYQSAAIQKNEVSPS